MIKQIQYGQTQIILVGIVHNSSISFERVKTILEQTDKSPVLLEYCQRRHETNQQKKWYKSIWHLLAKTELTIEQYVIDYCKHHRRPLKFIDMDIKYFLKHYYKLHPLRFIVDTISNLIMTPKIQLDKQTEITYENATHYYIEPELYDIIIEQRDKYMAYQIKRYIEQNHSSVEQNHSSVGQNYSSVRQNHKQIVVIVGKMHIPGILRHLTHQI